MAPVEVLGFNHLQLNEFCVGEWGGVDHWVRRLPYSSLENFRQIVEFISAEELCNE
jgi:hypothetical protein